MRRRAGPPTAVRASSPQRPCPPARPQSRAYRIFDLFDNLDRHLILSQIVLMIVRNYTYVFFTVQ
jgi:hypothetical protein